MVAGSQIGSWLLNLWKTEDEAPTDGSAKKGSGLQGTPFEAGESYESYRPTVSSFKASFDTLRETGVTVIDNVQHEGFESAIESGFEAVMPDADFVTDRTGCYSASNVLS
ncbi:hypothetical protein DL771_003967 [Monosporascus sp. 5C6A]|nr:hypothetical protein DL771_003967 [Monosporascus sp. 5C6A]